MRGQLQIPRYVATVLLLFASAGSVAEELSFQIFKLDAQGTRTPVADGKVNYTRRDIKVQAGKSENGPFWQKSLELKAGFRVGAMVRRSEALDGFGLFVRNSRDLAGFSWEWFDQEDGDLFIKRQGEGRVRVKLATAGGYEELVEVEFLDDIVLRYQNNLFKGPGHRSHEVLVAKGSILRLAP
jgi:hypothetical protein